MLKTNNWLNNPTRKQVSIILVLFFVSIFLMLIGVTNFVKEPFFQGKNFVVYFLILGAAGTTFKICNNYYKNKIGN